MLISVSPSVPNPSVPTISDPPNPNARAMARTGMAVLYPADNTDAVWFLYQDITGDIRQIPYTYLGNWSRSRSLSIRDVFNSSSLAAVSYKTPANDNMITVRIFLPSAFVLATFESNEILQHHLFYVDTSGLLRDIILTVTPGLNSSVESWTPGNLGGYLFKVPLVEGTGMSIVAVNGTSIVDNMSAHSLTDTGMLLLFVGGIDGLVHEYKYYMQNNSWIPGFIFIGTNGYAGISPDVPSGGHSQLWMSNVNGAFIGWEPCIPPYGYNCQDTNGESPEPWQIGMSKSMI